MKKPSAQDLRDMSNVLAYEWRMLHSCQEMLGERDLRRRQELHDALLESRLLHVRSLLEFFFVRPRYDDDIAFSCWFCVCTPEYTRFQEFGHASECRKEKKALDKYLAHLTSARSNDHKQHKLEVVRWLDELMILFVKLAGNRVGEQLKDLAHKYRTTATILGPEVDSTSGSSRRSGLIGP